MINMIRELSDIIEKNSETIPFASYLSKFGKGLYVCLEHPERPGMSLADRDFGDLDSGPVILGVGTSASGFALAATKRMGEEHIASGLEQFAIIMGNPTWIENRLYYVNMFHPVGQAVILFGKTMEDRPR